MPNSFSACSTTAYIYCTDHSADEEEVFHVTVYPEAVCYRNVKAMQDSQTRTEQKNPLGQELTAVRFSRSEGELDWTCREHGWPSKPKLEDTLLL